MKPEKGHLMSLTRFMNKEFLKFIVVGVINTAVTYIIYLALLLYFSYHLSYLISYILGIFISYGLNTKFVFKTKFSFRKAFQFPIVYVFQYLLNAFILYVFVDNNIIGEKIAPIIVLIISIPITFILSRIILKDKQ